MRVYARVPMLRVTLLIMAQQRRVRGDAEGD